MLRSANLPLSFCREKSQNHSSPSSQSQPSPRVHAAGFCTRLLALFALLALFVACDKRDIRQVVKEMAEAPADTTAFIARTVHTNNFSTVEIDCFADVTFCQTLTAAPYVRLQATKEVLPHVNVRTVEDGLFIAIDRRYRMPEDAVVVVYIYAPFASKFVLNGGKCLRLGQFHVASPLTIDVNGVASVTADSLAAHEVALTVAGDASADVRGLRANRLSFTRSGNGIAVLAGCVKERHIADTGTPPADLSRLIATPPTPTAAPSR